MIGEICTVLLKPVPRTCIFSSGSWKQVGDSCQPPPFYMDKDANAKEFNFARLSDLKLPVTFRM